MSKIKTILNLNQHPINVENYSLSYAKNMILDDDNILSSEDGIKYNETLMNLIKKVIQNYLNIYVNIYIIDATPVNEEIVLYVQVNDREDILYAVRYLDENHIRVCCEINYNKGNLLTKGLYNNNKLIVCFSEYFNEDNSDKQIPLKIFDFGTWDDNEEEIRTRNKKEYQPHKSVVAIPNITLQSTQGFLYKGWYFLFIRYKKYGNNYTNWYNLNSAFLLDEANDTKILQYYCKSKFSNEDNETDDDYMTINIDLSNNQDICYKGILLSFSDLCDYYNAYQIGYVISTKSYTKCYRTEDIDITKNNDISLSINDIEYELSDMIASVNVFYNVKAMEIFDNRLLISSYEEKKLLSNDNMVDELKKITINLNNATGDDGDDGDDNNGDSGDNGDDSGDDNDEKVDLTVYAISQSQDNVENPPYQSKTMKLGTVKGKKQDDGSYIIDLKDCYFAVFNIGPNGGDFEYRGFCTFEQFDLNHRVGQSLGTGSTTYVDYNYSLDAGGSDGSNTRADLSSYSIFSLGYDDSISGYDYRENYYDQIIARGGDFEGNDRTLFSGCDKDELASSEINDIKIKIWPNSYDSNNSKQKDTILIYKDKEYSIGSVNYGTNEDVIDTNTMYLTTSWWMQLIYDISTGKNTYSTAKQTGINLAFYPMLSNSMYVEKSDNIANVTSKNDDNSDTISNSIIFAGQEYYFCLHFVDKYGQVTQGYPLNLFDVKYDNTEYDKDTNVFSTSLQLEKEDNTVYFKKISLPIKVNIQSDYIKNNFVSYFVSYAYMENKIKGFYLNTPIQIQPLSTTGTDTTNVVYGLFNERLNYDDKIELGVNNYDRLNNVTNNDDAIKDIIKSSSYIHNRIYDITYNETFTEINKNISDNSVQLFIADTYNNILLPTYIKFPDINDFETNNLSVCILKDTNNKYLKSNKILIPCSKYFSIEYNKNVYLNTQNGFRTTNIALLSNQFFYNSATNQYQLLSVGSGVTLSDWYEQFLLMCFRFPVFDELPFTSNRINNAPETTFTYIEQAVSDPDTDTDTWPQVQQTIIQLKNTVDLLKCPIFPIYKCYPKTYIEFNKNNEYVYKMTNIVRRSNALQDESNNIAIRDFKTDNYKVINDDYGTIIKLSNYNNNILVHTKNTLLSLSANNSLNSNDGNVYVGQSDIFDTNVINLITNNKIGGIDNINNAIVCKGGYIFYSYIDRHVYKFVNSIQAIDNTIYNYIKNISINDFKFYDDKNRNRLLIIVNNDLTFSYNYIVEHFISLHTYTFKFLYTTVLYDYIIANKKLYYYINDDYSMNEITNEKVTNRVDIIYNNNYEILKYLENILYKLYQTNNNNNEISIPYISYNKYSPDILRIFNDNCDTDDIDISISDFTNVNKVENYKKPYYRMGNWHFNAIRNKIANYKKDKSADELSRVYGNYFVIEFKFISSKRVRIETLECATAIAENI